MINAPHPAASQHLPFFITSPGQADVLSVLMAFVLVGAVLGVGVFFFWLHSLPERMVHNKAQFDLVAVLALLSLFTHIHAFWVAALLLALVDIPQFSLPHFSSALGRIAGSLEKIANTPGEKAGAALADPLASADLTVTDSSDGKPSLPSMGKVIGSKSDTRKTSQAGKQGG